MADAVILFFKVPLGMAGIEAHLIKEELSEWNEYTLVQDRYRTNWWKPGSRLKRRPVIYSYCYTHHNYYYLIYTEFNYPRGGCGAYICVIFSVATRMAYKVC